MYLELYNAINTKEGEYNIHVASAIKPGNEDRYNIQQHLLTSHNTLIASKAVIHAEVS